MNVRFQPAETEEEMTQVLLFLLEHKRDLHPAFTTMGMVELLYYYLAAGHLYYGKTEDERIIAAGAYYIGTPEAEFAQPGEALIDVAMVHPSYRKTRVFLQGMRLMIRHIQDRHPDVSEVRLKALADNAYLLRMYAKFSRPGTLESTPQGPTRVFCENINQIMGTLSKFDRV